MSVATTYARTTKHVNRTIDRLEACVMDPGKYSTADVKATLMEHYSAVLAQWAAFLPTLDDTLTRELCEMEFESAMKTGLY